MNKLSWYVVAVVVALSPCAARSQAPVHADLSSSQARENSAELLRARSRQDREYAYRLARQKGWGIRSDAEGCSYQLIAIRNGRPLYLAPCNVNAAISTAANLIRGASPYNLTGAGLNVGIWDQGSVLSTHQEFAGRVTVKDGSAPGWHACHPAGTIMAAGVNTNAKGMAPAAKILSYDYADAEPQMVLLGASGPLQTSKIYLSNHSYDGLAGWEADTDVSGHQGVHWFGTYSDREDAALGQYGDYCYIWDQLSYNAKYYLPVKSAGNNRADNAPTVGTVFYYYTDHWTSKTYDPATDPYSDNHKSGFDTLTYTSCAKNALTVGAVNPAVSGGVRSVSAATMTTFTGWGPTDDGRVKPDIVADGVNVFSVSNENNTAYRTFTGASCAAANATGSAALLVEYYQKLFPSSAMLASTLKALIIHTADDLGNAGPDYSYGWGLMNVKSAADLLKSHKDRPLERHLIEDQLSTANSSDTWTVWVNSGSAFRVTLCWTDPPGPIQSDLNGPTPVLVNDLDLRIKGPGGSPTYMPYVLNPASPADPATNGDNTVDNVEQVYIASAPAAGYYTVTVSHKGTLSSGAQKYSLTLTGQTVVADVAVTGGPLLFGDKTVGSGATPAQSVSIRNNGTGDLTFTGAGIAITGANASQFSFSPAPSTASLAPGASRTVSVVFAPTSAGAKSASVTVTTNDPDLSTVDTGLSGNGVTGVLPEVNFGVSSQSPDENAGTVAISLSLSASAPSNVTVDYQVNAESTATGDSADYSLSPVPGTITFAPGDLSKTIVLTIINDPINEDNETVILQLTNPAGATVGSRPTHTVTIADDDAPPTIQFSFSTLQIGEGDSPARLTVQLSGNATEKTVTADIATADGTANAGGDYTAISQQITLTPPEASLEVDVPILDDSQPEVPEFFTVLLSNPENAVLGLAAVSVEIQDDDVWLTAAPNWMLY